MDGALANRISSTEVLSGVSWASILAGAFVSAAVSLPLIALGAGLGLASVSPWSGSVVSSSTFTNITGAYLVVIAVMSSAIGGYLASRLRLKWTDLHNSEVFFRDSAHGFVAWAFATVLSASLLSAVSAHLVGGTASDIGAAAGASTATGHDANSNAIFVDKLFRTDRVSSAPLAGASTTVPGPVPTSPASTSPTQNSNSTKAEIARLWTASFTDGGGLQSADRTYVAHIVAQQTGLSETDAQKRVDDVVNETKDALDRARRNTMKLSFWTMAALLFGAFAASLAAVEGGQHRDGTWNERRLTPRAW
jgi:hypothetical protein